MGMFIFLCICVYGCRDRGVCIYICIYIHSYGLRIARGLRIAKDYLRSAVCRITDCSTGRQNLKVPRQGDVVASSCRLPRWPAAGRNAA